MFAKPYKHKSNNTLKNSEKKHLTQRIQNEFPAASDEKVKELVPAKSITNYMKLVLHSEEIVGVYVVDGLPIMLEVGEQLVPTVCGLWKVPDLLPTLTIHAPVLNKIRGGAPLYLPGVVIPRQGLGFPLFPRGTLLAVNTEDNTAAAIVGRALMSSSDMLLSPAGVCLDTIQVFGDQLCKETKFNKIDRPKLGTASFGQGNAMTALSVNMAQLNFQSNIKEEWPSLGPKPREAKPAPVVNEPKVLTKAPVEPEPNIEEGNSMVTETSPTEGEPIPSDMDGLLRWCLLSFLKLQGKHIELPLKTNLLYKNHLFPLCPSDRTLDVKKSSYKKMGKFLEAMQQEGLIEVRELEKGVDALTAINTAHPAVRTHAVSASETAPPARNEGDRDDDYTPPIVREVYCITANVVDLFAPLKKGTALTSGEVRSALTEYVKSRSLDAQRGSVTLDATLARAAGKQNQEMLKWDELMSSVQSRMTAGTEMRFADGTVSLTKSRIEPVTMKVVTRSGNKKVTLVSNLECYGFNVGQLSAAWQRAAAAACGVTRSAGSARDQLMLQGDQTYFVAKLLIEKYGLPKKFVEGADKALKKKNK